MRPWLVVLGVLFLTLGAGLVAGFYLSYAASSTSSTIVTRPPTFALGPNATDSLPLSGSNGSTEQFDFTWQASAPIGVLLLSPSGCASGCGPASTLVSWTSNRSGSWSGTGPFHYPLQCVLKNLEVTPVNITLTGRAIATNPTHPSLGFELFVGAGGAALFVVAGVAVFLGVFLRGNPYGPPPRLVSRSADDIEELTRDEGPRH